MSSYSNYIRDYNMNRVHNRVFNDVLRNKTKTNSSKPMEFASKYKSSKEALAKYDCLDKIKNGFLNSFAGSTVVSAPSSSSSSSDNNSNSSVNSTSSTNSTSNTSSSVSDENTLNVCNGKSFDVKLSYNKKVTFTCKNGQVYMSKNTGELSASDMDEVGKIEQLITSLVHNASGNYAKTNFSEQTIKSVLDKVGIKPGDFTIKSSYGNNGFYMLDSGKIYSDFELESERSFYNNTDFINCFGYSKDAECKIDGKRYKIGSDGTFNIPRGVKCIPEKIAIIK